MDALPHTHQWALMVGMIAAKKVILLNWKSPQAPCFQRWLNEMLYIIQMEQLHFGDLSLQKRFEATWGPILRLLKFNFCIL